MPNARSAPSSCNESGRSVRCVALPERGGVAGGREADMFASRSLLPFSHTPVSSAGARWCVRDACAGSRSRAVLRCARWDVIRTSLQQRCDSWRHLSSKRSRVAPSETLLAWLCDRARSHGRASRAQDSQCDSLCERPSHGSLRSLRLSHGRVAVECAVAVSRGSCGGMWPGRDAPLNEEQASGG
jgi:hypothetical protein